jgi:dihydrofolate reductase
MSKAIADITMSLDGSVTGPSGDVDELHAWVTEQDPVDTEILERATAATGAVVMGRRLFDIVDGPNGWTRDMGYGAQQAATPPFFVPTHSAPQHVRLERELGMRFTFVDELRLHPAPTLLGGGTPLFRAGTRQRYRQRDVRPSSNAVHLTYGRSWPPVGRSWWPPTVERGSRGMDACESAGRGWCRRGGRNHGPTDPQRVVL